MLCDSVCCTALAFISPSSPASRRAQKWGQEEGLAALQDILKQVSELNLMWADAQTEFIGETV